MSRKRLRKGNGSSVTLQDVAEAAGVSTASVSRYLTSPDLVREQRRQQIKEAIDRLGYIPHGAARALASQRSRTIGAIVPTLDNAIFAKGIQAFQAHLQQAGYTLFVASHNYSLDEERTQAERLMARGIDGMMLIGQEHEARLYERLDQLKVPYVNTWSYHRDAAHPCVGFDNYDAAVRQASYLLDIGHKRFGVIAGVTKDNDRARERLRGVIDTLKNHGVALPDEMMQEAIYDIAASRQVTQRLLSGSDRPTAIICGNDILAYGAVIESQTSGLEVPKDISVVGFDDLPMSQHFQPPLTTMHVPSEEMGRAAAAYLLARLEGQEVSSTLSLETTLVVRDSTAKPCDV